MKVVIDTNALLSAAWRDRAPEAVVLWIAGQDDWVWMASQEILDEYREVLRREKFGMSTENLGRWENIIAKLTTRVDVESEINFPRDQKDAKFLNCAISAGADYLITGDKDFSEARKLLNTTILSVALFQRLIMPSE